MTREEAKREMMFAKRNVIADSWIDQAYDVAIQALSQPERKKGKWIDAVLPNDSGGLPVIVCDQCNTFYSLACSGGGYKYCPSCGSKMEVE